MGGGDGAEGVAELLQGDAAHPEGAVAALVLDDDLGAFTVERAQRVVCARVIAQTAEDREEVVGVGAHPVVPGLALLAWLQARIEKKIR